MCDCVFEGGRMQLCGGDLPSVQEVKQREREIESTANLQNDKKDKSRSMYRDKAVFMFVYLCVYE